MEGDVARTVLGVVLVLLGATGATLTQRHFEQRARSHRAPWFLVPFGVLIGAGAAMVRGWDLAVSMIIGGGLVPVVGAVGRLLEVRRARGGRRRPGADR